MKAKTETRITEVTDEMKLNDRLFYRLRDDYENRLSERKPETADEIRDLYLYGQIVKVFEENDIPQTSAEGLMKLPDPLWLICQALREIPMPDERDTLDAMIFTGATARRLNP